MHLERGIVFFIRLFLLFIYTQSFGNHENQISTDISRAIGQKQVHFIKIVLIILFVSNINLVNFIKVIKL